MGDVVSLQAWKDKHHPSEPLFEHLYAETPDGSFRDATPEEQAEIEQMIADGLIIFEE